ncbi:MAG: hypothetical protein KJ667_05730 [Alphaproteobacteria bacterium]|nr:hypothetical protein [Alphaproteobacteria bacterium]
MTPLLKTGLIVGAVLIIGAGGLLLTKDGTKSLSPEATTVLDDCQQNIVFARNYRCDCIAEIFMQERKKQPNTPKNNLMHELTRERGGSCVNAEKIHAAALKSCEEAKPSGAVKADCGCAAGEAVNLAQNAEFHPLGAAPLPREALLKCAE